MGKSWQWLGDHAESFNSSKRASWHPEPGHTAEGKRWLKLTGTLQEGNFTKPNWEKLLNEGSQGAEGYFNIAKSPNMTEVLEGDSRVEKQVGMPSRKTKE